MSYKIVCIILSAVIVFLITNSRFDYTLSNTAKVVASDVTPAQ